MPKKTLRDLVNDGTVSMAEVEIAIANFIANSDPLDIAPAIFPFLPTFDRLPDELRDALVEIALRSEL